MKRNFTLLAFILVASVLSVRAVEPTGRPEESIRSFYRWYVTALIANREPLKERAEMSRFATERLLKEIDRKQKSSDGLGSDYFVNAQDFDNSWAKNITVSNVKVSGKNATAEVRLVGKGEMRRRLSVWLVKDGASWKIDKVEGRD
ncbi:MAG: hypothetical protein QOH01_2716 [Verrucomicrobiota bacterium]|jgi:hypothetical protein